MSRAPFKQQEGESVPSPEARGEQALPEERTVGLYLKALRWLGEQEWFPAIGKPVFPKLDRLLYRFSGGRLTSVGPTMIPTLLLTTTGHRSGRPLTTPLFYVRDAGSIVVAGTKFGLPAHPWWSENLLCEPNARVQIGAHQRLCHARLASGEEIARAWPRLVELWPAYDRYKERSGRDIRVFVLEPSTEKWMTTCGASGATYATAESDAPGSGLSRQYRR